MANIVLPILIQGQCFITHGGVTTYFKNGIQVSDDVVSWTPESDGGKLGERHKARSYKLTGTPVGMLSSGWLNYAYAPHLAPSTTIGATIMNGQLVIYSVIENVSYIFERAGVFKPANILAGPTGTVFDAMDWLAIGVVSGQPTAAAFLRAGGTFTADTSYDETKIVTDIYSAALGSRSTPYNAMGSMDGFKLTFTQDVTLVPAGDTGWCDAILKDVGAGASFVPSNLTETQVDTLLAIQNTGATLPGMEYAKGVSGTKEDLVITGTQLGWIFTLKNAGAKKQPRQYMVGAHRHKELEFVNGPTYTTGVRNPYFAFTAGSSQT